MDPRYQSIAADRALIARFRQLRPRGRDSRARQKGAAGRDCKGRARTSGGSEGVGKEKAADREACRLPAEDQEASTIEELEGLIRMLEEEISPPANRSPRCARPADEQPQ